MCKAEQASFRFGIGLVTKLLIVLFLISVMVKNQLFVLENCTVKQLLF